MKSTHKAQSNPCMILCLISDELDKYDKEIQIDTHTYKIYQRLWTTFLMRECPFIGEYAQRRASPQLTQCWILYFLISYLYWSIAKQNLEWLIYIWYLHILRINCIFTKFIPLVMHYKQFNKGPVWHSINIVGAEMMHRTQQDVTAMIRKALK